MLSERFLFLSAGSLSSDFLTNVTEALDLNPNSSQNAFSFSFLFDLGCFTGKSDAKFYKLKLGPKPILALLALLAPHLAYSGNNPC
jgi:hypothetical protein